MTEHIRTAHGVSSGGWPHPLQSLWLLTALCMVMTGCVAKIPPVTSMPVAAQNQTSTSTNNNPVAATDAPANPLDMSMLPESPATPKPWVPFEVEMAMRATWCPKSASSYDDSSVYNLHRPCTGAIPRHLGEVLVAIPTAEIHLPADLRARYARQDTQQYLALPGYGQRPDFMALVDAGSTVFIIRSFEGINPADTVYYVVGPFTCAEEGTKAREELEFDEGFDELEAGDCRTTLADHRVYRWSKAGVLEDITRTMLPKPTISSRDRKRFSTNSPILDDEVISRAPTFRWRAGPVDEDTFSSSEPRLYELFRVHMGFSVWNGKIFVRKDRVSDALWPSFHCSLSRPDAQCKSFPVRLNSDPFIDYDTDWNSREAP